MRSSSASYIMKRRLSATLVVLLCALHVNRSQRVELEVEAVDSSQGAESSVPETILDKESLPPNVGSKPRQSQHTHEQYLRSSSKTRDRSLGAAKTNPTSYPHAIGTIDDQPVACAWAPILDPGDFSPLLPDTTIQYNLQAFLFPSKNNPSQPSEVYRVRAPYPYSRYFSYNTYDIRLQGVANTYDAKLSPTTGLNPFTNQAATEKTSGTYTIHLTRHGREGYPNELACLHANSTGIVGLMNLRFHLADPRVGDPNKRQWGGVDMPIIELLDRKTGKWEPVKECPEALRSKERASIEGIDIAFNRLWPRGLDFGRTCNASQFSLFDPRRNPLISNGVRVRNANENYIFFCLPHYIQDPRYIVRIKGILPVTPYGLYDDIRIPDVDRYDARYVSFTSAEASPLFSAYYSLTDLDIHKHYGDVPTASSTWDRHYTILATQDINMASRCDIYNQEEDMLLSFDKEPLTPAKHPAIVMRQLLPHGGSAREGEGTSDAGLQRCLDGQGNLICSPTEGAEALLGQFYPHVEVFVCENGVARQLY